MVNFIPSFVLGVLVFWVFILGAAFLGWIVYRCALNPPVTVAGVLFGGILFFLLVVFLVETGRLR